MFIKELLKESTSNVQDKLKDLLSKFSAKDVEEIMGDSKMSANIKSASFIKFIANGSAIYDVEFNNMEDSPEAYRRNNVYISVVKGRLYAEVMLLPLAAKLRKRN